MAATVVAPSVLPSFIHPSYGIPVTDAVTVKNNLCDSMMSQTNIDGFLKMCKKGVHVEYPILSVRDSLTSDGKDRGMDFEVISCEDIFPSVLSKYEGIVREYVDASKDIGVPIGGCVYLKKQRSACRVDMYVVWDK
jgi:hypothetical protein